MDITIVISNSEVQKDVSIKPSESFNSNLRIIHGKVNKCVIRNKLKYCFTHST